MLALLIVPPSVDDCPCTPPAPAPTLLICASVGRSRPIGQKLRMAFAPALLIGVSTLLLTNSVGEEAEEDDDEEAEGRLAVEVAAIAAPAADAAPPLCTEKLCWRHRPYKQEAPPVHCTLHARSTRTHSESMQIGGSREDAKLDSALMSLRLWQGGSQF